MKIDYLPSFLKTILTPKPQPNRDQKLDFNRNILQFFKIQIIVLCALSLLLVDNDRREVHAATLIIVFSTEIVFLLTCRTHIYIFNIYYALATTCYCHVVINFNHGAVPAFLTSLFGPLFVLISTNDQRLMFGVTIFHIQFIYSNLKSVINESLSALFSKQTIDGAIISLLFLVVLIYLFVAFFDRQCKKAQNQIREAYTKQHTFLLSLSHELRNPLNSILGSLQLALAHPEENPKENLENALAAGEILLQLINSILDTGKLDIEQLEVKETLVNFRSLTEKIWSIGRLLIREKGLKGFIHVSKEIPSSLMLDGYRFTQLLMNLIGNSIKFTKEGKITIMCDWISDESRVSERCFEPAPFTDEDEGLFEKHQSFARMNSCFGDKLFTHQSRFQEKTNSETGGNRYGILKVSVADTGNGISQHELDHLFQKFGQVGKVNENRQKGTGLGLYLCKKIVEKMKGEIKVFSKENMGTVFIFCIPIKL